MMDKLVIDASVAVKWFVVEPYSVEARQILTAYEAGNISLHAPDILIAEFANTIWKKQLFQQLAPDDATEILRAFDGLGFVFTPSRILVRDAYSQAIELKRSVYDSLYLASSAQEQAELVTADEKFFNAVHSSHPQIVFIADWHYEPTKTG